MAIKTPPPFDSQEWVDLRDSNGHLFGRYHPQTQTVSIAKRLHGERIAVHFPLGRYHNSQAS